MELKIMEWDHPLSYFQWSGPLWSSFEFRKFSIGLQKQLPVQSSSFFLLLLQGKLKHTSPAPALCLQSHQVLPCWDLLVLSCLIIPNEMGTSNFQIFPRFPTSCSGAQQWNPPSPFCWPLRPTKPCSFSLPSHHFPGLDFIPMHSFFSPCFFWPIPYFASSTSPRLSELLLQTRLKGFHISIPPAAPTISSATCL